MLSGPARDRWPFTPSLDFIERRHKRGMESAEAAAAPALAAPWSVSALPKPIAHDLKHVRGAGLMLLVAFALFVAAVAGGDFWAVAYLSTVCCVISFLLIVADLYFMFRVREVRALPACLLCADVFVLGLSIVLVYFWVEYQNGKLRSSSYGFQIAMDVFLLGATAIIFIVRLCLRAHDRENGLPAAAEVELMGSDRRQSV